MNEKRREDVIMSRIIVFSMMGLLVVLLVALAYGALKGFQPPA